MLKSHTLPGHWQQEGRICCRMEAEMGMARWHYRFNDYYDEGCVINPQAEQIKLSACKCHLMRVCVCCACKVLQCCWWWAFYFCLKEVTFLFPFSASVMFLLSLCSLSIRNPPHACFSQVDWIICSMFALYWTLKGHLSITEPFYPKRLYQFIVGHCLSASGLLCQVILVFSVLTWPLANALLHVWIFCPVFPQPVCLWWVVQI